MASIKPLGNRVLVKRLEAESVSAGGIVLPDSAQEKPQEAEVVGLGTGGVDENGKDIVFDVAVGDKVLISKYGGTDVKVDNADLLILSQSDILGVLGSLMIAGAYLAVTQGRVAAEKPFYNLVNLAGACLILLYFLLRLVYRYMRGKEDFNFRSAVGTIVNGQRIDKNAALAHGDSLGECP